MAIDAFSEKLDALPSQSVLAFTKEFKALVETLDLESLIVEEMFLCRDQYKHTPKMRAARAMNLSAGKWHFIDLMVFEDREFSDPLTTHPVDIIWHFKTDADYTIHKLHNYANQHFGLTAHATLEHTGRIEAGDSIATNSSEYISSVRAQGPIVIVALSNRRLSTYSWDFSAVTGKPICHYNNHSLTTVLELMAKLIGAYGDDKSLHGLKLLLDHESDTVKWQSAYAIMRIDNSQGIQAFQRLSKSDNVALASCALQTLERCEGDK